MSENFGPPPPIDFLREASTSSQIFRVAQDDSDRGRGVGVDLRFSQPPMSPSRKKQDAPARERPPPGEAWPNRVSTCRF